MPEFDIDAAVEVRSEPLACEHCGGRCTCVEWDEAPFGDWRVMHVTGKCRQCQGKTWFKYVYMEDKRMLDGETRQSDQDFLMAFRCPFCMNRVDAWDLTAKFGHRLGILDQGPVDLTDLIYFQADCVDCNMVRIFYRFDSVTPGPEDDWEMVMPDVDRRVLAPDNGQPEED